MNKGVYIALISIGLAQALKIPIHFFKAGKWKPNLFFQTGGMPSSHSAGVSSLSTFIALRRGIPTIDFALSLVYGLIVMYDAAGVRQAAGKQAEVLNKIIEQFRLHKHVSEIPLKELLGHTPVEVLAGALLGITIAYWK